MKRQSSSARAGKTTPTPTTGKGSRLKATASPGVGAMPRKAAKPAACSTNVIKVDLSNTNSSMVSAATCPKTGETARRARQGNLATSKSTGKSANNLISFFNSANSQRTSTEATSFKRAPDENSSTYQTQSQKPKRVRRKKSERSSVHSRQKSFSLQQSVASDMPQKQQQQQPLQKQQ